ncbi:putative mitochondrial calpain-like cysteine peptidase [Leptomonas pyrrhocoris]|uniref:Putative mitochondrial calpain-like cysteine peptidase n=1 Tax=Leptomonas pyrrhocoris TaxID=157538 RepID=A0A0N0VDD3_LEPPY|nr:putative mitochondrial calpain-like cysteine peptidase [Leptomonas pyrrhocoris]KPA75251.1 putative mitochondrial calpain-like cysteine peptidase [Leptomonas pyrrhocoris]|eukprot:XP_015653690.1 putative mitochondrial calpain-like cysteine peptidase [Leptomonas pyrrhocoris]
MGCKNSTTKSANDRKAAPAANAQKPAKKPAEKRRDDASAADASHITVDPTPAAVTSTTPTPPGPDAVKEDEKRKEEKPNAPAAEEEAEKKPEEEEETPAAAAHPESRQEEKAAAASAPTAAAAVKPLDQVATAPAEEAEEGEEDAPSNEPRSRPAASPIHQESQTQRVRDPNSTYDGPGPASMFPIDNIYRCFDEEKGLLFRLVNKKRHLWAFYNDTTEYLMRVSVTFGPESSVTPLDDTEATIVNAETGECTLVLEVPPGATKQFMRGEYNGFTTCYDATPLDNFEETPGAPREEPVAQQR